MIAARMNATTTQYLRNRDNCCAVTMPSWASMYMTRGVSKATPIQNSSRTIRLTKLLIRISGVATSLKPNRNFSAGGVRTKYAKATPAAKATSAAGIKR